MSRNSLTSALLAGIAGAAGLATTAEASGFFVPEWVPYALIGAPIVGLALLFIGLWKWPKATGLVILALAAFAIGCSVRATDDLIFADSFGTNSCDGCGESGEDPPLSCDGVAPLGFQRVTLIQTFVNGVGFATRDATTLRGLYGGEVTTTKVHWDLRRGRYVAFALTGAELEEDLPGRTSYAPGGEPQNGEPMVGFASVTISRCAGDFRMDGPAPGQLCRGTSRQGVNDVVYFTIGNSEARGVIPAACTLDRTSTYYLNVVFADATDGLTPDEIECPDQANACGWRWNLE